MKSLAILLILSGPALALDCIPEPKTLTYGEPASEAWVAQCERQFRNPLPTCHRLYAKPDDRALCLGVIEKLDAYDRAKHKVHEDAVKAEKAKAKK